VVSSQIFLRHFGGLIALGAMGGFLLSRYQSEAIAALPKRLHRLMQTHAAQKLLQNPRSILAARADNELTRKVAKLPHLKSHSPTAIADIVHRLLDTMRHALFNAVHDTFVISLVMAALALILVVRFLPEPVRIRRGRGRAVSPLEPLVDVEGDEEDEEDEEEDEPSLGRSGAVVPL
jgi:hypothetical protein